VQLVIDQDPWKHAGRPFDRSVTDTLAIAGTLWPMPNVGTFTKDGNSYLFAPGPFA
jgi:hypothetical protein